MVIPLAAEISLEKKNLTLVQDLLVQNNCYNIGPPIEIEGTKS